MHALFAFLLLSLAAVSGPALAMAQPAPAGAEAEVEGVDIVLPKDPKVVSTFPADGAAVPGGVVIVKIVFDQRMTPDAWSFARSEEGGFPDCLARPRLLNDRRTYVLLCTIQTSQKIAMAVNVDPGFVSAGGRAVAPFVLRFSTNDRINSGMPRALRQAGLTDADAPLMDWKGETGIASKAAPPP